MHIDRNNSKAIKQQAIAFYTYRSVNLQIFNDNVVVPDTTAFNAMAVTVYQVEMSGGTAVVTQFEAL
jgi:hypothetical protein